MREQCKCILEVRLDVRFDRLQRGIWRYGEKKLETVRSTTHFAAESFELRTIHGWPGRWLLRRPRQ